LVGVVAIRFEDTERGMDAEIELLFARHAP
jgi:hypothetical protein